MKTKLKSLAGLCTTCLLLTGCNLVDDVSDAWKGATFDGELSGRWGKEGSSSHDRQFMFIPKDGMHEAFDISDSWLNALDKESSAIDDAISFLDFRLVRSFEYQGKKLLISKRVGDNRGEVFAYSVSNGVLHVRTIKPECLVDAIKNGQVRGSILSESSIMTYCTFPSAISPAEMAQLELITRAIDTHARPKETKDTKSAVLHKLDADTLDFIVTHYDDEEYWEPIEPLQKLEDADGRWIKFFHSKDCISIVIAQMAETAKEMAIPEP